MRRRPRQLHPVLLALTAAFACSPAGEADPSTDATTAPTSITGPTATSITTAPTTTGATTEGESDSVATATATGTGSGTTGAKLDLPDDVDLPGCDAVDILFVIDNSASMAIYQEGLAAAFPGFVDAIFDNLPAEVDLHVGITTTDFFCSGCACPDSTIGCQSNADLETLLMYYIPPTDGNNAVNGSQGRLFEHGGQPYFATNTSADPAPLKNWFTAAAQAAGELGCSFEMPVAAASYVAHPANNLTNKGFIRDEDAVLLLFFLTDEPDKSPESVADYKQMLLDAKANCGGADCILTAGLIPLCVEGINQKLWQYMTAFGEPPIIGDIQEISAYNAVIGQALAATLKDTCSNIPQG